MLRYILKITRENMEIATYWSMTCQTRLIIAIYPTAIKSVLCHEKTRDILFLERPQGAREIKFREFSSDIKGLLAVGYVVLSHEAGWIDEVEHEFDMNLTKKKLPWDNCYLFNCYKVRFMSRENSRHFFSRVIQLVYKYTSHFTHEYP